MKRQVTELVVDTFAGGGGASLGIKWALGRCPDIAINHDASAIEMHTHNHPDTLHVMEDVWKVDFRNLIKGRRVGLAWFSPDCTDFSRAKGDKPVRKHIRSLAWVVIKWAAQVKPRIIMLENVREFAEWGPIIPQWECGACQWRGTEGQAILKRKRKRCPRCESVRLKQTGKMVRDPARKGLTFRRWIGRLRNLGYALEYRDINAADLGAPTARRRLFVIGRRDGDPIVWPEATHATPKIIASRPKSVLLPHRGAWECIDFALPCPSIFDRKRPLAEKTMHRIALGMKRYVLESKEPFLVATSHTGTTGRGRYTDSVDDPLKTVTASNDKALLTPYLCPLTHAGARRIPGVEDPVPTITTAKRGEFAVVSPHLIQVGYGERSGQSPRVLEINDPLGTVVGGGIKHALCSAFIAKHFGGMVGVPADYPLPTTTSRGTQNQLIAATLAKYHGDRAAGPESRCNDPADPLRTMDTANRFSLVAANLIHFRNNDTGSPVDAPLNTITGGAVHAYLVYSFLTKYFGTAIGANLWEPMPTATGKARFGLVTVTLWGELWVVIDIGMRMLTPRELATAQGFPKTYWLPKTKEKAVARIGNSVCPIIPKLLVEKNFFPVKYRPRRLARMR